MKFINFKNLSFMYVWQISNYALSFLLMPYLARTLYVSGFGAYSYVVSINTYLWIMVEWGFPTGGMREVASNRDDPVKLQNTFWKLIYAKLILIAPAIAMLLGLVAVSDADLRQVIFLSGLATIIGAAFACEWFAQGIEQVGRFITISISARLAVTILTFVLVKDETDAELAALLHGANGFFGGLVGFVLIMISYKYFPKKQSVVDVWRCIVTNFSLFLAKANGILYVSAPPLALGLLASTAEVGIYSGADKIARICVLLIGPISIVVTPGIFASMKTSRQVAAKLSGRYLAVQIAITIPMSLALLLLAPQIIYVILGDGYGASVMILRLLSPIPVLIGLSNSLGNQFLIPLALDRQLAMLSLACSLTYLAALAGLTIALSSFGAGLALLMVEFLMIGGAMLIVWRKNREYVQDAWNGVRTLRPLELIKRS